ncbi:MAG: 2'-5' RNA ligase family protein [Chthoniobacterales bacterium]
MTTNGEIMAFWLRPAQEEREYFAALIRRLATRFDAPRFEPHVTLYAGAMEEAHAAEVVRGLAALSTLTLEVEGVACAEEYTKTLFVQFRASDEAARLSAEIAEAANREAGYRFDPHLSLIYQPMARAGREELRRTIEVPFTSVRFDAVEAIVSPARVTKRAEVEAWRVIRL